MGDLDIFPIPTTHTPKEYIVGFKMQDMEVGMNRSTTCPCSMLEKVLMALVEEGLGLGPSLLPTVIQVIIIYHLVFIVMVITEVVMFLTPANFLHITMLD